MFLVEKKPVCKRLCFFKCFERFRERRQSMTDSNLKSASPEQPAAGRAHCTEGATFNDNIAGCNEPSQRFIFSHHFLLLCIPTLKSIRLVVLGLKHERDIPYRLNEGVQIKLKFLRSVIML